MEDKLETLKILIENRAFAPTYSAYAKDLGYKGRAVIYRLMEGRVNDKTVNKIYEKTCKKYHLGNEAMYRMENIFFYVKNLYNSFISGVDHTNPEWIITLVKSLINCSFDEFPDSFREKADILKDLKLAEPEIYWGIVAVVYIWAKKIDVYQGSIESNFRSINRELNDILFNVYPEKQLLCGSIENLLNAFKIQNLTDFLFGSIAIFLLYTDNNFVNESTKVLYVFDFDEISYWCKPGERYGQFSDVWILKKLGLKYQIFGYYCALHLKAGKDIHTFLLDDVMFLFFMSVVNDEGMPMLFVVSSNSGKQEYYNNYIFRYDKIKKELCFSADSETGNLLGLPDTLCMINTKNPEGKDEKVWARIMTGWFEHNGDNMLLLAAERLMGIIDMSDSYQIEDVIISMTLFKLIIIHEGFVSEYRLPIEKYKFLSEINPSQMVVVAKHQNDDELMAYWPEFVYTIKLSEFEVKQL